MTAKLLPRPWSDLIELSIRKNQTKITPRFLGHIKTYIIKNLKRINLVALGALAIIGLHLNHYLAGAVAGVIGLLSFPALVMGGGNFLMGWGISKMISAFSKKVLSTLGIGIAALLAGYFILLKHDFFQVGLLENKEGST